MYIQKKIKSFFQSPIVKNFLISSFGSFLMRSIGILLAPITMKILNPSDYGIIALSNSFVGIVAAFISLGMRRAFTIEYFHCNTIARKILINGMISLYMLVATPFIVFLVVYPSIIKTAVFANQAPTIIVVLSLVHSYLYFFVEFFYQLLTYRAEILKMTIIQTSVALFTIALNITFLVWFKWGAVSIIAGQVIGLIIVCLIGMRSYFQTSCHQYIKIKNALKKYKGYLKYGLPFVPGALCSWIFDSSDRWVLAHYATIHDVGIYSLASVFGQLFQILILIPMERAYIPAVMKKFSEHKDDLLSVERWNRKMMVSSMIGLGIIISVGYVVCKPILYYILPLRYQPAIKYIWMILMGYIFLLGERFANIFIVFKKKIAFQAASFIVPSMLNLSLNLILVPHFGITGCVIATMLASASHFIIKFGYNFFLGKKSE